MTELKVYRVLVDGNETTMQLTEEQAQRMNATPVDEQDAGQEDPNAGEAYSTETPPAATEGDTGTASAEGSTVRNRARRTSGR